MPRMRLSDSDHSAYFLEAVQKHMEHEGHGSKKKFKKFAARMLDLKNKRPNDPSDPVLQDIKRMLSPHPYLIQELNCFLPPSCRLEAPVSQDNSKIKVLEDGLDFIQLVKERVSVNEFKSFVHLLSEPSSSNESISEIEKLLSQHTDLIAEFEHFKPLSKRVSKRRRSVQQETSKLDKDGCRKMLEKMHDVDVEARRYTTLAERVTEFLKVLRTKDEIGRLEIRVKDYLTPICMRCLRNLHGKNEDEIEKLLKEKGEATLGGVVDYVLKIEEEKVKLRQKAFEAWRQQEFI